MRRTAVVVFFLACSWVRAQTPEAPPAAASPFENVDQAVAELAEITGLAPLKKVDTGVMDRVALKQYIEEKIKEETDPKDIRLEELALKRFGLAPADFDLKATTVDLLTEQAAAFYDFKKKKLFLMSEDAVKLPIGADMVGAAQSMIVVHELAHALADQHFNLEKFIRRGRTDDASTARMAVMEGQATWLMMEHLARKAGQSLTSSPLVVEMMGAASRETMLSQYPVLSKAPLYIQSSLLFPYTGGLKFQNAVIEKSGKAGFAQVFKQPPSTTQQVIHPDKYFARVEAVTQKLPEPSRPKEWTAMMDGTVGEFDHAVLLEQYFSKAEADDLAPHWRGGHLGLIERKADKHVAMLYTSEWADAASAKRMFDFYRRVLKAKWKTFKVDSESESTVSGTGDYGPFRVTLEGKRVISVEGAPAGK